MKVWIFYLSLPDDVSKFNENDVENFQFISGNFSRVIEHDGETETSRMLYAYTIDKKLAYEFQEMHDMNLFTMIKRKMDQREFKEFQKENKEFSLFTRKFGNKFGDKKLQASYTELLDHLLITEFEENVLYDDIYVAIEQDISEVTNVDYYSFKTKYIEALDYLMYCTYHKMVYDDPDTYGYNLSYGITAEGFVKRKVSLEMRAVTLYFIYFAILLRKDDE